MDVTCSFQVNVTVIANDFIDRYMASANGEYVKVYLYVLRHQYETIDVGRIADALDHTEADVRRALSYWEKIGALKIGSVSEKRKEKEPSERTLSAAQTAASRTAYSQDKVNLLAENPEFKQLLYIAQQYMKKQFTPRETEVFAYLYDGLHMSAELLEYLVEYCVQGGHTSIRYIETVALNWHEKGLAEVEAAKAYTSGFSKNSFAVMKAFGLANRRPGDIEKEHIERWFFTYGFSKEIVLEACNRTLKATQSPSFSYAEKILSQWHKANVKSLQDVAILDQKRQPVKTKPDQKPANKFHNFEQRNTDYDSIVMDQLQSWIRES